MSNAAHLSLPLRGQAPVAWWKRKSVQAKLALAAALAVLLTGSVIYLLPYFWVFSTALKTPTETVKFPPVVFPAVPQWRNFIKAWTAMPFNRYTLNSLITSVIPAIGEVLAASLVGYSFGRLRWPGRDKVFGVLLLTMMLPGQVTMIPRFVLFSRLGWINTFWPLIVPHLAGSAFYIFLTRQFMVTIPRDLDEAAKIDGSGLLGIWWRIIMPLCQPALASVAIFSFLDGWSSFMPPLLYLNSNNLRTLMLALPLFNEGEGGTAIHLQMALTFLTMIPPLAVFFLAQKQFVQGIAMTGMKG